MPNGLIRYVVDLVLILVITVLPHVAGMPMLVYPPVLLLVLWIYLRWRKSSFADLGFKWRDFTLRAFLVGGLIGIVWALFLFAVLGPLILKLTGLPPADLSDFDPIRHSWSRFITLIFIAWLLIIPYEEIVFRGFVLTALRRLFGDRSFPPVFEAGGEQRSPRAFWLAAVVHSLLFAAYHWQEGGSALISIFIGSMLTVWLYRMFNGNLWYIIFFHAAYDTVMLTLFRYGLL